MEQEIEQVTMPFTVHESDMARADRKNKRLWMTLNGVLAIMAAALIIRVFRGSTSETVKS